MFPRHSPSAWARGDQSTATPDTYVAKMASKNLQPDPVATFGLWIPLLPQQKPFVLGIHSEIKLKKENVAAS